MGLVKGEGIFGVVFESGVGCRKRSMRQGVGQGYRKRNVRLGMGWGASFSQGSVLGQDCVIGSADRHMPHTHSLRIQK